MFEGFEEWRAASTTAMARYVALAHQRDELDAQIAVALADAIQAYRWPAGAPLSRGARRVSVWPISGSTPTART